MSQICKNIKQARVSAGKTQQELADLLKIKRSTYANWESTIEPGITDLRAIAGALTINWTTLIGLTQEDIKGAKKPASEPVDYVKLLSQREKERDQLHITASALLKSLELNWTRTRALERFVINTFSQLQEKDAAKVAKDLDRFVSVQLDLDKDMGIDIGSGKHYKPPPFLEKAGF